MLFLALPTSLCQSRPRSACLALFSLLTVMIQSSIADSDWQKGVTSPRQHFTDLKSDPHTGSIHPPSHITHWRNHGLARGMLLLASAHRTTSRSKTHASLDPTFDSFCICLIEWPRANAGARRSQTLRQTGNTEKINLQLSIIGTEWHHHTETSPHTWINANKQTSTMIRHLWNLQSICSLNSGPWPGALQPLCSLLGPICFVPWWKPDN